MPEILAKLRSLLSQAAHARSQGKAADAERLYKEAASEARPTDAAERAEALMGTAQTRRDQGDRVGAAIYYAEAITLLRTLTETSRLAYALRHAADVRSELGEFAVAGSHIEEAVRLYRALDPPSPLDLANALRVFALNGERGAHACWSEACRLYTELGISQANEECNEHLACLKHHEKVSSSTQEPQA